MSRSANRAMWAIAIAFFLLGGLLVVAIVAISALGGSELTSSE